MPSVSKVVGKQEMATALAKGAKQSTQSNLKKDTKAATNGTEMDPTHTQDLIAKIQATEREVSLLIDLIPSKFYIPFKKDPENQKYFKNKLQKAPKQEVKMLSKKGKRLKLNPEQPKTSEIVQERTTSSAASSFTPLELQEKLRLKIQSLASSSYTPKSRQEMLDARQKKQDNQKKQKLLKKQKFNAPHSNKAAAAQIPEPPQVAAASTGIKFGKIDFGIPTISTKGPSDAQSLLKKVQNKQDKLELLKSTDSQKADKIQENLDWSKVMKQASGEKVKDDISLLKKTVKRKQGEKQKSSQEWKTRKHDLNRTIATKQQSRQDNIQKRIDQKKDKKMGIKPKKAKGGVSKKTGAKKRPGFEGSRK